MLTRFPDLLVSFRQRSRRRSPSEERIRFRALLSFARHLTSESKPLSTFYGVCYTVTREPRNGFPVVNARQTWNNPQYEGVDGIVCFIFILVLGLCCYIAYFLRGVPNRWAIQIFWNCFCPFFGHLKLTHPVSIRCGETRGYS